MNACHCSTPAEHTTPSDSVEWQHLAVPGVWLAVLRPHDRPMTSNVISHGDSRTDDPRWRSIVADLAFWSVVGAIAATVSGPLGDWWHAPQTVLIAGGLAFVIAGVVLLFGLNRQRPISRSLVRAFGLSNLVVALIAWPAALFGWFPLSGPGRWALVAAGGVALALGVWQLSTMRRSPHHQ